VQQRAAAADTQQVIVIRLVAIGALSLVAVVGCGADRTPRADSIPADLRPPSLPDGEAPGPRVAGTFHDAQGHTFADVHELISVGTGSSRSALLLARSPAGVPCLGVQTSSLEPHLDCLQKWDRSPLFVRVAAGGSNRRSTDWIAVLGWAGQDVADLEVETQRNFLPARLEWRSYPGLPWRAFAAITERGAPANTLVATGTRGDLVATIDLGWAYNPPCQPLNDDICTDAEALGTWAEARDPVSDASGTGERDVAKQIAFDDEAVRRLVQQHGFTFGPTASWYTCTGREIGAVVSLRFYPAVSFAGEIPVHAFADEGEPAAYRSGRAYVEADGIDAVEIWIDSSRGRVAGIDVEAFDFMALEDWPTVRVERMDVTQELRPAGTDDPAQCPPTGD